MKHAKSGDDAADRTKDGNFPEIEISVFTFFTSEDESLPKELVLDANGKERFWKYLPKNNKCGGNVHNNFVNYIKNYPYPCVINDDTAHLPDFMDRVSFDEILAQHKTESGRASALRGNSHGEEEQDAHGGLTPNRSPSEKTVPVGTAVVDITPEYPVRLTGYGNRLKESEGVAARIHARAMAVGR